MLNNDLEIPFFKPSGAYLILIQALGMVHIKDNIYYDPDNKKWVLTKYGFQHINQYNLLIRIKEIEKEYTEKKEALNKDKRKVQTEMKILDNERKRLINEYNEGSLKGKIIVLESNLTAKQKRIDELKENNGKLRRKLKNIEKT